MRKTPEQREAIEAELLRLAKENGGRLTPEAVVDAAADEASPLHGCFTWDDAVAATQHRLEEARTLIRSVVYTSSEKTITLATPFYVRDPSAGPKEQGYILIEAAKRDRKTALAVLAQTYNRLMAEVNAALAVADLLDPQEAKRIKEVARKIEKRWPCVGLPANPPKRVRA